MYTDHHSKPFFHYAVQHGSVELVQFLLHHLNSPQIHWKDDKIRSALHFAAESGRLPIFKCLNHFDVYARDRLDWNVLHFASKSGNVELFDYLITNYTFDIDQSAQLQGEISLLASHANAYQIATCYGNPFVIKSIIQFDPTFDVNVLTSHLIALGDFISH